MSAGPGDKPPEGWRYPTKPTGLQRWMDYSAGKTPAREVWPPGADYSGGGHVREPEGSIPPGADFSAGGHPAEHPSDRARARDAIYEKMGWERIPGWSPPEPEGDGSDTTRRREQKARDENKAAAIKARGAAGRYGRKLG